MSISLSVCLYICLFVYLCVLSVFLFVRLSIFLFLYPVICLVVCLSVCMFVCLSVCPYVNQCVPVIESIFVLCKQCPYLSPQPVFTAHLQTSCGVGRYFQWRISSHLEILQTTILLYKLLMSADNLLRLFYFKLWNFLDRRRGGGGFGNLETAIYKLHFTIFKL